MLGCEKMLTGMPLYTPQNNSLPSPDTLPVYSLCLDTQKTRLRNSTDKYLPYPKEVVVFLGIKLELLA